MGRAGVFGASFVDHTGIASYKPIVQVDADPNALGRFRAVTVPMFGDIGFAARLLLAEMNARRVQADDQRADVAARRAIWRPRRIAARPTITVAASRPLRCSRR